MEVGRVFKDTRQFFIDFCFVEGASSKFKRIIILEEFNI